MGFCRTAQDPELKKEALLFETGLRFVEPIDGRTAASLAEAFRRHAPDDNRAGELFRLASAKLDEDWYLRAGLMVIIAVPVRSRCPLRGFTASARAFV